MGVKISNLPAIVTPALTDTFPVVQERAGEFTQDDDVNQLNQVHNEKEAVCCND